MFPNADIFYFDLTCDVIKDPELNKIRLRSTTLAGLLNAVRILKTGPIVSEIEGGYDSPPNVARYRYTPVGRG